MQSFIVIEGTQRDEVVNCVLHGLFASEHEASAFASYAIEHGEWNVASYADIAQYPMTGCTFAGWSK